MLAKYRKLADEMLERKGRIVIEETSESNDYEITHETEEKLDFISLLEDIKRLPDTPEKWQTLEEFFIDVMDDIYENDCKEYNKYWMKLYKKFFGKYFNYELAEKAIMMMHHADMGNPMVYCFETSQEIAEENGYIIPDKLKYGWWWTLNMIHMDYHHEDFSDEDYIRLAYDFFSDEDSPVKDEKPFIYFYRISLGL